MRLQGILKTEVNQTQILKAKNKSGRAFQKKVKFID